MSPTIHSGFIATENAIDSMNFNMFEIKYLTSLPHLYISLGQWINVASFRSENRVIQQDILLIYRYSSCSRRRLSIELIISSHTSLSMWKIIYVAIASHPFKSWCKMVSLHPYGAHFTNLV